jgi:hypothetical protein
MSNVAGYTFPNTYISVIDDSIQTITPNTVLPLHLPLFAVFAAQGLPNVPVLGDFGVISAAYGAETFNPRGVFFQHPTEFALNALQFQQCMFVRLVDPEALTGNMVLECAVTGGQIPQYMHNSDGSLILNESGDPTPQMSGGLAVTAAGVTLAWSVRALTSEELYNGLTPVTVSSTTTYPIIATSGTYPGSGINNTGFSLYYTPLFSETIVENIGAMTYQFAPATINPNTNLVSPILDKFNNPSNPISFLANAQDPTTTLFYDLPDVLSNNYLPGTIPYNVSVYETNVATIAAAIVATSPNLTGTNPALINILTCIDANQNPYWYAQVTTGSAQVVNQNVVLYNQGGTDGTTTKTMLENLTEQFMTGVTYPSISDNLRYPFSHFYDSGYSLATKQALLQVWSTATGFPGRDDVKFDFCTQDVANVPNTEAQDQAAGATLRTAVLLYPESELYGTQAIRASIYQQCAKLASNNSYQKFVPANLDRLIKRCIYDGSIAIKGTPKGRPNSEVTVFDQSTLNWAPSNATQKQLSWSTGLNYISYCDIATLFYSDLRSVYPTDASLLSDDVFVDRIIYIKYIVRRIWTIYSGVDTPIINLFTQIGKRIDKTISTAFGGTPSTNTIIYQTENDSAQGFAITVQVNVQGTIPNRIWNVLIPVSRLPTASSSTTSSA